MGYTEEFARLRGIITDDNSSPDQIEKATEAVNALIDNDIEAAIEEFESRTADYDALIARLGRIVDDIKANRLSEVITKVDELVTDVNNAASG